MPTPLTTPVTVNITLETQEDVNALFLRANMTPDDLSAFYNSRGKTHYNVPDVRMRSVYKALKAVMNDQGFTFKGAEGTPAPQPSAAAIVTSMG